MMPCSKYSIWGKGIGVMHICSNKCSCSNKCLPSNLDVKNDDFCPISGTFKASNKHPLQKKRKSKPILCCKGSVYFSYFLRYGKEDSISYEVQLQIYPCPAEAGFIIF